MLPKAWTTVNGVKHGGERGIRTLDGIAPEPHFQFAPEEGSEGLLAPTEVRCRCLEDS